MYDWQESNPTAGDFFFGVSGDNHGNVVRGVTYVAPVEGPDGLLDLAAGQPGATGFGADLLRNFLDAFGVTPGPTVAVVDAPLSYTSVAHELGHALFRVHASNCNGGGSGGQVAESWPPDQRGFIDSIGLDTYEGSGAAAGPYNIISGQIYDPMSYCADEGHAWMSAKGWNEIMSAWSIPGNSGGVLSFCCPPNFQPPGAARDHASDLGPIPIYRARTTRAARIVPVGPGPNNAIRIDPKVEVPTGKFLQVHAVLLPGGGARILEVHPATGFRLAKAKTSAVHLEVEGANGRLKADVAVAPVRTHFDRGGPVEFVDAQLQPRVRTQERRTLGATRSWLAMAATCGRAAASSSSLRWSPGPPRGPITSRGSKSTTGCAPRNCC